MVLFLYFIFLKMSIDLLTGAGFRQLDEEDCIVQVVV